MQKNKRNTTGPKARKAPWPPSKQHLQELTEEAIVDAYDEYEQRTGFLTMIQEHLALPFDTELLGITVIVERVDLTTAEEIVAICRRGSKRQPISILDLPLPKPPPAGAEWIESYRLWSRGA
jgi:hypothetical protein